MLLTGVDQPTDGILPAVSTASTPHCDTTFNRFAREMPVMSKQAESGTRRDVFGLEALRQSLAFRGSVEPLDDHEHFGPGVRAG